ncbi:MAG: hypothetical protein AAF806_04615 [Bacteroidota bacterium]
MKNLSILCSVIFFFSSFFFNHTASATPNPIANHVSLSCAVIIPAGTIVSLELNQRINSEVVEVGQTVSLRVRYNVIVNNKVVIRTGAIAEGRITDVNKACDSCGSCQDDCSEVTVEVQNVQAVTGERIYLEGTPHRMRGNCCGKGATIIRQGTRMEGTVRDNVRVTL